MYENEPYWGKPETEEEQALVDYIGMQCMFSVFGS